MTFKELKVCEHFMLNGALCVKCDNHTYLNFTTSRSHTLSIADYGDWGVGVCDVEHEISSFGAKLEVPIEVLMEMHPEGFTADCTGKLQTVGYAVGRQVTKDLQGLEALPTIMVECTLGHSIGYWKDDQVRLDSVAVYYDEQEALEAAKVNGQKAIYCLHRDHPIYLRGDS